MVTLEDALNFLGKPPYDKDRIKDIAIRRLKRVNTISIGSRWLEESPEDVLTPLLDKTSPKIVREGVLDGWIQVHEEVYKWLDSEERDHSGSSSKYLEALCRVAEISHPTELEGYVKELLNVALNRDLDNKGEKDRDSTYEILSAKRQYQIGEKDLELVDRLILNERFAAAAFDMLIQINPRDERVKKYFYHLWCNHYDKQWQVDPLFLALRLIEIGSDDIVVNTLKKIKEERRDIWPKVVYELKQSNQHQIDGLLSKVNHYCK